MCIQFEFCRQFCRYFKILKLQNRNTQEFSLFISASLAMRSTANEIILGPRPPGDTECLQQVEPAGQVYAG